MVPEVVITDGRCQGQGQERKGEGPVKGPQDPIPRQASDTDEAVQQRPKITEGQSGGRRRDDGRQAQRPQEPLNPQKPTQTEAQGNKAQKAEPGGQAEPEPVGRVVGLEAHETQGGVAEPGPDRQRAKAASDRARGPVSAMPRSGRTSLQPTRRPRVRAESRPSGEGGGWEGTVQARHYRGDYTGGCESIEAKEKSPDAAEVSGRVAPKQLNRRQVRKSRGKKMAGPSPRPLVPVSSTPCGAYTSGLSSR